LGGTFATGGAFGAAGGIGAALAAPGLGFALALAPGATAATGAAFGPAACGVLAGFWKTNICLPPADGVEIAPGAPGVDEPGAGFVPSAARAPDRILEVGVWPASPTGLPSGFVVAPLLEGFADSMCPDPVFGGANPAPAPHIYLIFWLTIVAKAAPGKALPSRGTRITILSDALLYLPTAYPGPVPIPPLRRGCRLMRRNLGVFRAAASDRSHIFRLSQPFLVQPA